MIIRIFSIVENGRLKSNRKALADSIREFEGKDVVISIQQKRRKMSDNQRGYYFGVICSLIELAIRDQWGERMSKTDVHEMLKRECNYIEKINENTGEILKLSKSIKTHTTTEQEDYHSECRSWAKEWLNIDIPLPNEQMEINIK